MGQTPTTFELPAGPDGTATAELVFVLAGYPAQSAIAGGSADVVLFERLQKRVVVHVPPPDSVRSAAARLDWRAKPGMEALADPGLPKEGPPATPLAQGQETPTPPSPPQTQTPVSVASTGKPAAPAVADPNVVVPFSDGMTRPVQLSESIPIAYTREAREVRAEGIMAARCVITVQGTVERCRVIKSVPMMEETVIKSFESRHFRPAELNGQPVAVWYLMTVRLSLPH
jgi:serine/threonine-protein kinase